MPQSLVIDEKTATDKYAHFTAAPFQSGFGHTIGNALRRVLLSSLEGSAISAVRIDGVSHEFTTLPNVVEDVTEIILNLKKVKLNLHADPPKTLEIRKSKAGPVTAADIVSDGTVEILNPIRSSAPGQGHPLQGRDRDREGSRLDSAEKNKRPDHPLGTILVDCLFSPVTHVRYQIGQARVGEETEMDSLIIEVWTDGRIAPKDASRGPRGSSRTTSAPSLATSSEKRTPSPPSAKRSRSSSSSWRRTSKPSTSPSAR
jgi:DNA-directed RNA polymerase subunit alpha